jgi:hypothetical protein
MDPVRANLTTDTTFRKQWTPTENRADGYVSDAIFFHFSGWSRDEFASRLGDELNLGSDDDIDG